MRKNNTIFNLSCVEEAITNLLYMVPYPFIIIYFDENDAIRTNGAPILLFTLSFTARLGRLIFGPIIDKIPTHILFSALQLLSFIGFIILPTSDNFFFLFIACTFIGFFYGNSLVIIRSIVSNLTTDPDKNTMNFARLNIATNLPALCGSFLFNKIYSSNSKVAFFSISIVAIISSIWSYFSTKSLLIPQQKESSSDNMKSSTGSIAAAMKGLLKVLTTKKTFIALATVMVMWFLYMFTMAFFPLYLKKLANSDEYTWIFTLLNAFMNVAFSVLIHKFLTLMKVDNYKAMFITFVVFIFSILSMIFFKANMTFMALIIIILITTIAEIITVPTCNALLANSVSEEEKVIIFGTYAVGIGIGEALGSSMAFKVFNSFVR